MSNQKAAKAKLEAQLAGSESSQIPVHVIKSSYERMLLHAKLDQGVWVCAVSGSRIKLRMVRVNIFDRAGDLLQANVPVGSIYCARCDKIPLLRKGDGVYGDNLQTIFA